MAYSMGSGATYWPIQPYYGIRKLIVLPVERDISMVHYIVCFNLVKFHIFSQAEIVTTRPVNITLRPVSIVPQPILYVRKQLTFRSSLCACRMSDMT